jgi:hypothetical protein
MVEKKDVTKRHYNWSPGLVLGTFCTIFRAGPVWMGLGAPVRTESGRKSAETKIWTSASHFDRYYQINIEVFLLAKCFFGGLGY